MTMIIVTMVMVVEMAHISLKIIWIFSIDFFQLDFLFTILETGLPRQ